MRQTRGNQSVAILGIVAILSGLATPQVALSEDACSGNTGDAQRMSYCEAAKQSKKASDTNKTLTMVYSGVAAVCGTACVASFMGWGIVDYMKPICTASSLAGGVTDAVMTKNFVTGLTSIGGAAFQTYMAGDPAMSGMARLKDGFGKMTSFGKPAAAPAVSAQGNGVPMDPAAGPAPANGVDGAAGNAGEAAKGETDMGSCIQAGLATMQAFMKNNAAKSAEDAAQGNLQAAAKVAPTNNQTYIAPSATGQFMAGDGSRGATSQPGGSGNLAQGEEKTASICSAGGKGDFHAAIQCAVAGDPALNGIATNPNFGNAIKQATGLNPDDFMKQVASNGPSQAVSAGMASNFGSDIGTKVAALMAGTEREMGAGGYYAGGGGGGRRPASDDGGGFDKMFGDMMAQLGPKKDGSASPGVNGLQFGSAKRYPANVENDRFVSIFERVTSRYHTVYPRVWY